MNVLNNVGTFTIQNRLLVYIYYNMKSKNKKHLT